MFKIGEIVRVGEFYRNQKNNDPKYNGSFVIINKTIVKFLDTDMIFYDIKNILTNEVEKHIGNVWLEWDIDWYRKRKLERICSKLEIV